MENLDLENNIKTDLKNVECEDVDLIHVAQEHSNDFSCSVRSGEFIQNLSHLSRTPSSMGLGSTIIAISQSI
jgi:muramidase (phage lysozyme)